MADLYFINTDTTVDDIIDHILFVLNKERTLCVNHYCVPKGNNSQDYNQNIQIQVKTKLLKYGLVTADQNVIGRMNFVSLAEPGTHFAHKGDWLKHINESKIKEEKDDKKQKNKDFWQLTANQASTIAPYLALLLGITTFYYSNENSKLSRNILELKDSLTNLKKTLPLKNVKPPIKSLQLESPKQNNLHKPDTLATLYKAENIGDNKK